MIWNPSVAGLKIDFLKFSNHFKLAHMEIFQIGLNFSENLHFEGSLAKAPTFLLCFQF